MHLWACETHGRDSPHGGVPKGKPPEKMREEIPGSPFSFVCNSGDADAEGSSISGFSKAAPEISTKETGGKKNVLERQQTGAIVPPARAEKVQIFPSGSEVGAGEILVFKPLIHDKFENPAAVEDDMLKFELFAPDGSATLLDAMAHAKHGLTAYEARYEPRNQGDYSLHISIADVPIQHSPLSFVVLSGFPDVHKSWFETPEGPLFSMIDYSFTLFTADKWGNRCSKGGAYVSGRISSHSLPAGQDVDLEVEDLLDGCYRLKIMLRAPAEVKCMVTIAREKPSPAAGAQASGQTHEMPALNFSFVSEKAQQLKEEREREKLRKASMGNLPTQTPLLRGFTSANLAATTQERQPRGTSVASASSAEATPQASVRPHAAAASINTPQHSSTPQPAPQSATPQPAATDDSKKGSDARKLSTELPRTPEDATKQKGKLEDMATMEFRYDESNPNVLSHS